MSAYSQFGYSYPAPSQLLVAGQPAASTSPPAGAGSGAVSPAGATPSNTGASAVPLGPSTTPGAVPVPGSGPVPGGVGGGAPGPGSGPPPPPGPGSTCCENGRPIMTDPVSGQTVCSCQYDSARLAALSSYPRLSSSGVGPVGVYGTPYPSTDQNPYPSIGVDSSAFYSPLSNPYGLKDSGSTDMTAWTPAGLQPTTGYYPYDPTLAAYGYGAGYDLAARRKNATRESTATLKAWLSEHKKNPYPTKGEKIMLAIITKMTLTQVSTWFANARRRLKKENKMTWEPKNKTDDDEDAIVSDSDDNCNGSQRDKDEQMLLHQREADKEQRLQQGLQQGLRDEKDGMHMVKSEQSKLELDEDEDDMDELDERKYHMQHPYHHPLHQQGLQGLPGLMLKDEPGVPLPATKPKIWSLADTAACKTPPPPPPGSGQPWPSSCAGGGGGPAPGMGGMGMNGFALPSASMSPSAAAPAPYSRYAGGGGGGGGGFFGGGSYSGGGHPGGGALGGGGCGGGPGFPDVQTDTPPQTPPNMKLPSVAGNLNCFQGNLQPQQGQQGQQGPPYPQQHYMQATSPNNYNRLQQHPQQQHHQMQQQHPQSHLQQMQQPQMQEMSPVKERSPMHSGDEGTVSPYHQHQHQMQQQQQQQHHMMNGNTGATPSPNESTAFKPFYKSSPTMGGGFVSPV